MTNFEKNQNIDNSFNSRMEASQTAFIDLEKRGEIVRDTYLALAISMIPTIIGAFVGVSFDLISLLVKSPIAYTFGFLLLSWGLMFLIEKNRYSGLGLGLLFLFTFIMGIFLAPILQNALSFSNGVELIATAVGGTAVIFFSMAAIGTITKKDLGFLSQFILIGFITGFVLIIVNLFLGYSFVSLAISGIFMAVSSTMIIFSVNNMVNGGEDSYISATLTLYVSIYNVFVSLLNILLSFAGQRN